MPTAIVPRDRPPQLYLVHSGDLCRPTLGHTERRAMIAALKWITRRDAPEPPELGLAIFVHPMQDYDHIYPSVDVLVEAGLWVGDRPPPDYLEQRLRSELTYAPA